MADYGMQSDPDRLRVSYPIYRTYEACRAAANYLDDMVPTWPVRILVRNGPKAPWRLYEWGE
jgi:hypothetical protein